MTILALIAATVSYLHMHALVALHGQPGWVAALTPLSVDGMIVTASTTLLAESRSGGRGGVLRWALLVFGSVASLAANVAVAEPSAGRAGDRGLAIFRADRLLRAVDASSPADGAGVGAVGTEGVGIEGLGCAYGCESASLATEAGRAHVGCGCAAAGVAVGGSKPGCRWFAAKRQGDRGPLRSAGAVGQAGQEGGNSGRLGRHNRILKPVSSALLLAGTMAPPLIGS